MRCSSGAQDHLLRIGAGGGSGSGNEDGDGDGNGDGVGCSLAFTSEQYWRQRMEASSRNMTK